MSNVYLYLSHVECSFIQNEINWYLNNNYKVIVVSSTQLDITLFKSKNISNFVCIDKDYSSLKAIRKYGIITLIELIKEYKDRRTEFKYLKKIKHHISTFFRTCFYADYLLKSNRIDKNAIHISYWLDNWAIVLTHLKRKGVINKFYSRAHGRDLFEEREPIVKRIAFRKYICHYVDTIYSVSNEGKNYLSNKYPKWGNRFKCMYLGSNAIPLKKLTYDFTEFTIVSCGYLRDIKRYHRIPEVLNKLPYFVKWVHIGSIESDNDNTTKLFEFELKKILQNSNIEIVLKGELSNSEVYHWYSENNVSLLISLSETEGIPVSMMEAISYGIPILATDVGGCKEIVNNQTGRLVNKKLNIDDIVKKIGEIKSKDFQSVERIVKIKEFWKDNFYLEQNMKKFMNEITEKL